MTDSRPVKLGSMLDRLPNERESVSWLFVGLCSLAIFLTVPLARTLQSFVADRWGNVVFVYAGAGTLLLAAGAAIHYLRKRDAQPTEYLLVLVLAAGFVTAAHVLTDGGVEIIHFVEYGILGALVYRAFLHRIDDVTIFVASALVVSIIGTTDEAIQWATPGRVWELRDILINTTAGVLTLLAIAVVVRPRLIRRPVPAASLRRLCNLAVLCLLLLGFSFWNTPDRVKSYASRLPVLNFLLDGDSMMIEYGYRYEDPDIGVFRSRFTLDQLEHLNDDRGAALAAILADLDDTNYRDFLRTYTALTDPFVHEAGVHLFRRNRWLDRVQQEEMNQTWQHKRSEHYNIPFRENRILEKYFPAALQNAQRWPPELRSMVESKAGPARDYASAVSLQLITETSESQMLAGFAGAISGLLALSLILTTAWRRSRIDCSADKDP
ncbi:MAG: VanZ family protein [Gammaproteobacteria bacterium]|nr:VanZ family protein [Gammaproteobacteria bacterium]